MEWNVVQSQNRNSSHRLLLGWTLKLLCDVKEGFPWWLSWSRICLQCGRPGFHPWVEKIPWRRERRPTAVFLGFPGGSAGQESTCSAGDPGSIPGSGRSPGEGTGYPLQYSWASLVIPQIKNLPTVWETWLQSLGWEDPLEEGMATHSSILAWRISKGRVAWKARKESDTTERLSTAQQNAWHTAGAQWREETRGSRQSFCPSPSQRPGKTR